VQNTTWLMNTGFLEDNRNKKQKSKDFLHEELDFGTSPEWLTRSKALKSTTKYEKFDQKRTSSCVANSGALALGIDNEFEGNGFAKLSPAFMYRLRVNYPDEGMYAYDIGNIGKNFGSCLFETLPTPSTEKAINNIKITDNQKEEAKTYKAKNYVFMNKPTIDQLKNIANTGESILVSIFAKTNEWSQEYPEIKYPDLEREDATIKHVITVLPNSAYEYRGKKYVIVQDSAWFGGKNIRHLSEEFVEKRLRYGLYYKNLPNPTPSKEKKINFTYRFNRNLKVGMRGADVVKLQEALRDLGFFNYPVATGYFGGITRKAVIDFQEYYANDVLKYFGLSKGTGYVGWTTRAKLHRLM
jgi:hypothetical protein